MAAHPDRLRNQLPNRLQNSAPYSQQSQPLCPFCDREFLIQLRQAMFIVWSILTLLGVAILLTPFFIDSLSLMAVYPHFETTHPDGESCLLCGMTRAFYCIAGGRLNEARIFNPGSLWLWGLLAGNALAWTSVILRRLFLHGFLFGR